MSHGRNANNVIPISEPRGVDIKQIASVLDSVVVD